ncbi:hypothetical protein [Streptomyces sp. TS71-3]|nr:hypothetical protein [Streptomyces sp. TS71-3]
MRADPGAQQRPRTAWKEEETVIGVGPLGSGSPSGFIGGTSAQAPRVAG